MEIVFTEDPEFVLSKAAEFLASRPVLHNVTLTVLHSRVKQPGAGRYWIAMDGEQVRGAVIQSPLTFPANVVPMEQQVVTALVSAIAQSGVSLPGVTGEAATAALFAGQWTERCKVAATPFQGYRLYELLDLAEAPKVEGVLRQAETKDRNLLIRWSSAFQAEVGEPATDHEMEVRVDTALATGDLWLWDDGEGVSMAITRRPVERVIRISGVYTPDDKRRRGYAEACVHTLSKQLREIGHRCILYTDLANPTSNSIYRRIGYSAVAETLRYRFT
jgi:predicted GNAT family acetyltransferase